MKFILNESGHSMRLRSIVLLLGLFFSCSIAPAQIGAYGSFVSTHLSATANNFQAPAWYYGGGVGIYNDFLRFGPAEFGIDLRGDLLTGSQQRYRSELFGVRLAVNTPGLRLRPYLQGSIGVGGASHTGLNGIGTIYSDKFQYHVFGGLDSAALPHLEWRIAEVGYGKMNGISSAPPTPIDSILTLSSGLVFRFR
jgi:hypothetical protein